MENKTAQEIIRERSDTKNDYFLYSKGERDTIAEDMIIRWMEKYSNQQKRELEALIFSFRNEISNFSSGIIEKELIKRYDKHFNITSDRYGKI